MYSVVLFDFDFTLVDSSEGIIACIKYAFRKMGKSIPDDEKIRKTIGMSLDDAFIEPRVTERLLIPFEKLCLHWKRN